MAKAIEKLTALGISKLKEPGRYSDGGNLYLVITPSGSKVWSFMYRFAGGTREAGLGSAADVTLKAARLKAREGRELLARRPAVDPLTVWRAPAKEDTPTFGKLMEAFLETKGETFRSAMNHRKVAALLRGRTKPLSKIPVDQISTAHVLAILKPMAAKTPVQMKRLRMLVEGVLDTARAHGHIGQDVPNPARWRGHLELLLPTPKRAVNHYAALEHARIPELVAELRELRGSVGRGSIDMAAFALEYLILCAARSNEVLAAKWAEIDLEARLWRVPGARMKAGRDHEVPLSDAAMAILEAVPRVEGSPYVFTGSGYHRRPGERRRDRSPAPLGGKVFERLLERMGHGAVTPHGMRSSFRDFAGDETEFPRELAEAALAHAVGDQTERAYRRGSALERRRALMQAWSAFIDGSSSSNVIPLRRA
jgi:integrase